MAALALGACTSTSYAQTQELAPAVPGEFIIKYKDGHSPAQLEAAASSELQTPSLLQRIRTMFGAESPMQSELNSLKALESKYDLQSVSALETYDQPGAEALFNETYIYKYNTDVNTTDVMRDYENIDGVEYIEPNYIYTAFKAPNDPNYNSLWGMKIIKAEEAWEISTGAQTVKVGVVDTGIEVNHPDLKANTLKSEGMGPGCPNNTDTGNHGSHVAGTIGAVGNNTTGVAGVNWAVSMNGYAVLCAGGSGSLASIAAGVNKAVADGNKVINMSLGGSSDSTTFHNAIINAKNSGVTVVVAAGNCWNQPQSQKCPLSNPTQRGSSDYTYPAAYPEVITTAATTSSDQSASFSNRGRANDIAAPGVQIESTWPPSTYQSISGTSMASPHVAGAAGLLLSVNPNLTPDQVQNALQCTADDLGAAGWDEVFGHGRLNLKKAIDAVQSGNIPTCSTPGQPPSTPLPTNPGGATNTPAPTGGQQVHPCPEEAAKGNYNCTTPTDDNDYKAWEAEFKQGVSSLSPWFEYIRKAIYN
ncbi:MAG: Subtilisin DY [Microgenomates bacterium OLB23]|nr:MAG: Subtilisin DY [Microgenomates bacterium OLB23]